RTAYYHLLHSSPTRRSSDLHCLRSRDYVNVIVAGKQPALSYLDIDSAIAHCTRGLGVWEWASTTTGEPDVVLACAGDVPTLETLDRKSTRLNSSHVSSSYAV